MERLTEKRKDKDGKETYEIKTEFLSNPIEYTREIINRLGEYEELEESGLLLRLPCKVDDFLQQIENEVIRELIFLTSEGAVRKMKDQVLNAFSGKEG